MKTIKFFLVSIFSLSFMMMACNNSGNSTEGTSPGVNDTAIVNPTTNALDYHPDQSQQIPRPDSSNTIGTDTINASTATPNTGTQKTFNDKKGNKDSSNH